MAFAETRAYLLGLPRVTETLQWNLLVYWVLDKAVGGKMFATLDPEAAGAQVLTFSAPPERYHDLLERDGVVPAPYLARVHWVAVADWQVFPQRELHDHLHTAYLKVEAKLPPRTQRALLLSARDYRALVREARSAKARPSAPRKAAPPAGT